MQVVSPVTQFGEQANKIAASVQTGDDNILTLWQMCHRYAMQQVTRWHRAFSGRCGVEIGDLEQSAFVGLLKAVQTWRPEDGAFSTWYTFFLKSAFTEVCGARTERDRRDPLNNVYRPIDEPIGNDDGDLTLGELIPDPAAEAGFEEVEEREMQNAVYAALDQLPQHERDAIIAEFWHGQTVDRRTHAAALRHLRHPSISRGLRPFYE